MTTTTPIKVPLVPSIYANEEGKFRTPGRIIIEGAENGPIGYGLGFVDATTECRREQGGPILPGPYAYLFGLAAVIDNYGGTGAEIKREGDLVVRCAPGDLLDIGGVIYEVTLGSIIGRRRYPSLTEVSA